MWTVKCTLQKIKPSQVKKIIALWLGNKLCQMERVVKAGIINSDQCQSAAQCEGKESSPKCPLIVVKMKWTECYCSMLWTQMASNYNSRILDNYAHAVNRGLKIEDAPFASWTVSDVCKTARFSLYTGLYVGFFSFWDAFWRISVPGIVTGS